MTCTPFKITAPDGTEVRGFYCGPGGRAKRCKCGVRMQFQCDWIIRKDADGKVTKRCDKALCVNCTTKPATNKDLCPDHVREWDLMKAKRLAVGETLK